MRNLHSRRESDDSEPLGIVIADGGYGVDALPRFSAFVWGPAPEESELIVDGEPLAAAAC